LMVPYTITSCNRHNGDGYVVTILNYETGTKKFKNGRLNRAVPRSFL
jgi:hypothetical protein